MTSKDTPEKEEVESDSMKIFPSESTKAPVSHQKPLPAPQQKTRAQEIAEAAVRGMRRMKLGETN